MLSVIMGTLETVPYFSLISVIPSSTTDRLPSFQSPIPGAVFSRPFHFHYLRVAKKSKAQKQGQNGGAGKHVRTGPKAHWHLTMFQQL
jgi:hypothetical protein